MAWSISILFCFSVLDKGACYFFAVFAGHSVPRFGNKVVKMSNVRMNNVHYVMENHNENIYHCDRNTCMDSFGIDPLESQEDIDTEGIDCCAPYRMGSELLLQYMDLRSCIPFSQPRLNSKHYLMGLTTCWVCMLFLENISY